MNLIFLLCTLQLLLFVTYGDGRNVDCQELSEKALEAILGATYNPRYMRIDKPPPDQASGGLKRASAFNDVDFFMNDFYDDNPYEGIPAWEVDHVEIAKRPRRRREVAKPKPKRDTFNLFMDEIMATPIEGRRKSSRSQIFESRPWQCGYEVNWIDLGSDHFPRYIRSVDCVQKTCWYDHYICKPKRLSVKVLRRSSGNCAKVTNRLKIFTLDTVTREYVQQWEFVEKAITFCCDCVFKYK